MKAFFKKTLFCLAIIAVCFVVYQNKKKEETEEEPSNKMKISCVIKISPEFKEIFDSICRENDTIYFQSSSQAQR